jgi:hypothetical protein
MRVAKSSGSAFVVALVAGWLPTEPAAAQNVGLSAVRSLRLLEPQAGGFGPQPSDYFGWTFASGDTWGPAS